MKNRTRTNFWIDVLLTIVMAAVGGIGFLMKYVLVPGSERWEKYGSNTELYFWNLDRHQWGDIHLILSFLLLALLVLHIIFHWYQITCMFKNCITSAVLRLIIVLLLICATIVLLFFSFVIPVADDTQKTGLGRHRVELGRELPSSQASTTPVQEKTVTEPVPAVPAPAADMREEHTEREERTVQIFGASTLQDVSATCNVPIDSLKKFLGIPEGTSDNQRLGRLRRLYNFHMSDVERYIEAYRKRH